MAFLSALLLLLAPEPVTPFDPPPPGFYGDPGARARYAESLTRLAVRLDRSPSDVEAIERLRFLNAALGREERVAAIARRAYEDPKIEEAQRLRAGGVLGLAMIAELSRNRQFGNVWVFVNGQLQQQASVLDDADRAKCEEAIILLRAAIPGAKATRREPLAAELREALANGIEALRADPTKPDEEAMRLRHEAGAVRARFVNSQLSDDVYTEKAGELAGGALALEQTEPDRRPDHVRALEMRKQALVYAFCADTIPFDFAATLYEPVSLLAPRDLVDTYLTRTYTTQAGAADFVAPKYHGAPIEKRRELIAALGADRSNAADAVLLAIVRRAESVDDPLAAAAMAALRSGEHAAARSGLPVLLAKALYSDQVDRYPPCGQQLLVELAVALDCKDAVGVLHTNLPRDHDLHWPRGVAWALGRLAPKEDAPKLLAVARDTSRNIAFRRGAARGCARLDPEAAKELEAFPELALALAAARYETAPDEATKGRLLNGFANDLEIHVAARYCAELRITEAAPAMERFLQEFGEKKDHPARIVVERALAELTRES